MTDRVGNNLNNSTYTSNIKAQSGDKEQVEVFSEKKKYTGPAKTCVSDTTAYIKENKLENFTGENPPRFTFGKYQFEVKFYRNPETGRSLWVYSIYDENGERIDNNSEEIKNFVQETFGYESLNDMIAEAKMLDYNLTDNQIIFRLPNSQFAQTRNLDDVKGDDVSTNNKVKKDYKQEAEDIYNLLLEDLNNPEKFKEHADMLNANNIADFILNNEDNVSELFEQIISMSNISEEQKEYFFIKLIDCALERAENKGLYVDDIKKELESCQNGFLQSLCVMHVKSTIKMTDGLDDKFASNEALARKLIADVHATNAVGLPTTGKNFSQHIKQINSDNVYGVLNRYSNITGGESIKDDIDGEWGLDKSIKEQALKYINNCLINNEDWQANKPNGKIDESFYQNGIGDCWLLGTIASIAASPKGLEILNNTIKLDNDGNYKVKFKGCEDEYTVTPLEILSLTKGANGDKDIRILEIAADKHYNITGINGGYPASALDLLLGTEGFWRNFGSMANPINDTPEELKEIIKNPNNIVMTGVNVYSRIGMPDDAEYSKEISYQHAYAVVDMDDNYVYLKNPWRVSNPTEKHSEDSFRMPIKDFTKYLTNVQYVTIEN